MCRHDYGSRNSELYLRPGNQGSQCQFQLEVKGRGNLHPSSFPSAESEFSLAQLCSIQAFNRLDEGLPAGGQSSLLGLPMWMLTSSGRLRIHIALTHSGVWSNIWALRGPVRLIHKVNYCNGCSLCCPLSDTYNLYCEWYALNAKISSRCHLTKDGGPRTPFETFGMNGNRKTGEVAWVR